MPEHVIYVVGNKFSDFCRNEGVLTADQLAGMIRRDQAGQLPPRAVFLPGQGLRDADIDAIMTAAEEHHLTRKFEFRLYANRSIRAGRRHTHKWRTENSLISIPRRVHEDLFEMDLMIDDRSEQMSDHQTGQHIQGMVLIEGARQSFLAVTEHFYLDPEGEFSYYFVINNLSVNYSRFLFPVEALIRYEILEKEISAPLERLYFRVQISFIQAGKRATEVEVAFTAYREEKISANEQRQAAAALRWSKESLERGSYSFVTSALLLFCAA